MASQDRNSFAEVWDQLDAKWAERVRVTDASALGDEEIVRRWPQIGEGYLSKCMTALSLFTDASNSKPQLWVKDPVVGREVFPGIYRMVTVDVDVQKPGLKGIIQTLRKGFATAPQWAEARLDAKVSALSNAVGVDGISGTTSDPVDRVFDVLFPNCSPLAIESIADSLRTADYSSGITVRGELHAGAWHVLSVSTKLGEDGSASATLRIATPQYTINAYDDYGLDRAQDVHYVMDVPKEQAQGIVTAWRALHQIGSSATISYSRDQKLVDITLRKTAAEEDAFTIGLTGADCRYLETETIYLNVSSPSLYPISAPTNGAGVSYTRNVTRNINGTWDIEIKTRTARYRDAGNAVVEVSAAQATQQRQQLGVTAQAIEAMAETPGVVKSQRVEIRDDCSKDVTTTTETGKPLVTTEKTVARSYEETTTSTQTASAELPAPVKETSFIKTVRNEQSKYPGRWNVLERIRRILHIPSAVKYDNRDDAEAHGRTEESIGVPNTSGVAVVLSADAGTAVRAQVRYDKESDTLDVSKDVTTAKEQVTTEITEARSYRETVTQKTAQDAALPDPVEEAGFIKTVRNEASDYANRYNTTERVREIKQIDEAVEYDHADDASVHGRTVERLGQPNAGVAVTLAAGAGEALSASVRYDKESDTLDVEEKTLTVKPQESTRKVEAAGFSETTTEKTAQASAAPAPTSVDGHIKTARTVASRYEGKYDTEETDREVKALDATAGGGSPLWDVSEEVHANASADMAGQAAGGSGVVVESSSRKNDAGRFDNQKRTRTAKAFGPKSDAHGTPLVDETTEYYRNQDAFPSPGTPVVGTMIDVSGSINEAGKIDYTKTTKTAKPKEILGVDTGEDEFRKETTDIHVHKDSVVVSRAPGEVVDAGLSIDEFGKIGGSVRKSTAKQVVSGPFTEHDDGYKKTTKTIHRNVDSVPAVTTDDNGHDISVQVNEHGKKDVVETETTVRAFDIDIEEPTNYNEANGFQRICYGLRGSNEIQPKVTAFMAKVSMQPNSRYRVTASVDRDENGFYKLTLNANPKDSNGGGGSASDWDAGIDYTLPDCLKTNPHDYEAAKITYCSNRIKARDLLEAAPPKGDRIAHGAGGITGIQLLGRGRYKVTVCYGFD